MITLAFHHKAIFNTPMLFFSLLRISLRDEFGRIEQTWKQVKKTLEVIGSIGFSKSEENWKKIGKKKKRIKEQEKKYQENTEKIHQHL